MCQHCVAHVKKALEAVDGVKRPSWTSTPAPPSRARAPVDDATLKAAVEEQERGNGRGVSSPSTPR